MEILAIIEEDILREEEVLDLEEVEAKVGLQTEKSTINCVRN